jgi:signal transduction histidine kinase
LLSHRARRLDERAEALDRDEEALAAAAAEEERRRIARELHDIIAHGLGVMVLQAGAAEQVIERNPASAREALAAIRTTGQDAVAQMGTLLDLVRSGAERSLQPQPVLANLPDLVAGMREAGLDVTYVAAPGLDRLSPSIQLSAYRVAQEGLTNALKHAADATVMLSVRHRPGAVDVDVTDNGSGGRQGRGSRSGLAGIAERVHVFGGTLSAGPVTPSGWRLHASFPVAE